MRCRVVYKPIHGSATVYPTRWFPRLFLCHEDADRIEARTFEYIAGSSSRGRKLWLNLNNGLTYYRSYVIKLK